MPLCNNRGSSIIEHGFLMRITYILCGNYSLAQMGRRIEVEGRVFHRVLIIAFIFR